MILRVFCFSSRLAAIGPDYSPPSQQEDYPALNLVLRTWFDENERLMLMKQLSTKFKARFHLPHSYAAWGFWYLSSSTCAIFAASGSERRRNIATTPNNARSENHKDVAPAHAFEEQRHKFN